MRNGPPKRAVDLRGWVVGDTGFEPVTSSVSRISCSALAWTRDRSTCARVFLRVRPGLPMVGAVVTRFVTHRAGDLAALEPPVGPDGRRDVRGLIDLLAQQLDGARNPPKWTAWHCSIRNAPEDRLLSDAVWRHIAGEVMNAVKLAQYGDPDALRWIAVPTPTTTYSRPGCKEWTLRYQNRYGRDPSYTAYVAMVWPTRPLGRMGSQCWDHARPAEEASGGIARFATGCAGGQPVPAGSRTGTRPSTTTEPRRSGFPAAVSRPRRMRSEISLGLARNSGQRCRTTLPDNPPASKRSWALRNSCNP